MIVRYAVRLFVTILTLYSFQQTAYIIHGTDRHGALFANGQELFGGREGHGGYAFGALKARDKTLGAIIHTIDDDVVAAGVDHYVGVEEK